MALPYIQPDVYIGSGVIPVASGGPTQILEPPPDPAPIITQPVSKPPVMGDPGYLPTPILVHTVASGVTPPMGGDAFGVPVSTLTGINTETAPTPIFKNRQDYSPLVILIGIVVFVICIMWKG